MNNADKQQLFERIRAAVLRLMPTVWAIYAHGSIVKDQERRDSDLDIALLLPPGERVADPLGLAASLAAVAGREVDIADLRQAGNFLCKEVLANGETLYVANPEQVLNWEAIAMSEYATHRERIRDLLDDFNKTGIGYAHE